MCPTLRGVIFLGLLLWAGAEDLHCSVTGTADQVTYHVTGSAASSCEYNWSNGTGHVLANHAEEPSDPVTERSQESLTTKECVEAVSYQRACMPEGILEKASCTTNCSGLDRGAGGTDGASTVVTVFSVLLVIVAVVIFIIFISVRRNKNKAHESADSSVCLNDEQQ